MMHYNQQRTKINCDLIVYYWLVPMMDQWMFVLFNNASFTTEKESWRVCSEHYTDICSWDPIDISSALETNKTYMRH